MVGDKIQRRKMEMQVSRKQRMRRQNWFLKRSLFVYFKMHILKKNKKIKCIFWVFHVHWIHLKEEYKFYFKLSIINIKFYDEKIEDDYLNMCEVFKIISEGV